MQIKVNVGRITNPRHREAATRYFKKEITLETAAMLAGCSRRDWANAMRMLLNESQRIPDQADLDRQAHNNFRAGLSEAFRDWDDIYGFEGE